MEQAHGSQIGAIGLELEGGGKEMIDAPMLPPRCFRRAGGGAQALVRAHCADGVWIVCGGDEKDLRRSA